MESPRPANVKLVWVWPITFNYCTTKFKRACVLIPIKENKPQINGVCWTIQTSNEGLSGGWGEKGWSHWICKRKLCTETTRTKESKIGHKANSLYHAAVFAIVFSQIATEAQRTRNDFYDSLLWIPQMILCLNRDRIPFLCIQKWYLVVTLNSLHVPDIIVRQ